MGIEARLRSYWGWWIALLAAVALTAFAGWWIFSANRAAQARTSQAAAGAPIPVTVATVSSGDFPVYLESLGIVQAANTVTVRAQTSGQIQEILFQQGQIVHQGDILVRIDPRPLQAALDQAQAKLNQDQASLKNAQAELKRYTTLTQQQVTTREQLDQQTAAVSQGNGQIAADQAAVEEATLQLRYATIRAPITGRAGFRLVDVGNIVAPSDTNGIVTLDQVQPINVLFSAPEDQLQAILSALSAGKPPVDAISTDGSRVLDRGTLSVVNNQIDAASGTIRLQASFPNEDNSLWPGLSLTARVLLNTIKSAVLAPQSSVQHGPDGLYVYVAGADNKAQTRKISVSESDQSTAVVVAGLKVGDQIVVSGQSRLQPGALVAAKPTAPAETQASKASASDANNGLPDGQRR